MDGGDQEGRAQWLGLLARAPGARLTALCVAAGLPADGVPPGATWLRRPEIGTVMVRGRAGGTGAPFNLGEMTVTRAALRLADGRVGHGHVQGRDRGAAGLAALVDALMQGAEQAAIRPAILDPLAQEAAALATARAERAAATKVEFFTLVRGEDA